MRRFLVSLFACCSPRDRRRSSTDSFDHPATAPAGGGATLTVPDPGRFYFSEGEVFPTDDELDATSVVSDDVIPSLQEFSSRQIHIGAPLSTSSDLPTPTEEQGCSDDCVNSKVSLDSCTDSEQSDCESEVGKESEEGVDINNGEESVDNDEQVASQNGEIDSDSEPSPSNEPSSEELEVSGHYGPSTVDTDRSKLKLEISTGDYSDLTPSSTNSPQLVVDSPAAVIVHPIPKDSPAEEMMDSPIDTPVRY